MYAVITGASRGIGKALAYKFAEHRYDLILTCEKSIDLLEKIRIDIEKKYGRKVYIKKGLLDKDDLPNDIYILINNAGKCDYNNIFDVSYEKYKDIIYSNLDYTFLTTQLVANKLVKNKLGVIINISSIWGIVGSSCEVVYSMTKGGINAFTKALSKELNESCVDVIAFALGAVDTDMNSHMSKNEKEEFEKTLLGKKMFSADYIANCIYDIVSKKRYISGDIIELNNGLK